jgi:hypothetical protein
MLELIVRSNMSRKYWSYCRHQIPGVGNNCIYCLFFAILFLAFSVYAVPITIGSWHICAKYESETAKTSGQKIKNYFSAYCRQVFFNTLVLTINVPLILKFREIIFFADKTYNGAFRFTLDNLGVKKVSALLKNPKKCSIKCFAPDQKKNNIQDFQNQRYVDIFMYQREKKRERERKGERESKEERERVQEREKENEKEKEK